MYFLTLQSCFFVQICSGPLCSTFRDSINLKSVSGSWYQILHSIYCCHFHIYDAFICETVIVRLSPSVLHLSNQTKPVWTVLKHENFESQQLHNVTWQPLFPQIMYSIKKKNWEDKNSTKIEQFSIKLRYLHVCTLKKTTYLFLVCTVLIVLFPCVLCFKICLIALFASIFFFLSNMRFNLPCIWPLPPHRAGVFPMLGLSLWCQGFVLLCYWVLRFL